MAKKQTFADKAKNVGKKADINVKVVKTMKSDKGSYKFQESFVKVDDISKVNTIK
ncbi:MAG: hypothetical protein HYS24_12545 [Ignavibacteriales bacterium]|jgi:hypothetical protein|nr:hypothetical protein [Ignavibacteriales bacterium]MBK7981169.1 hypothetical protein [Ignavibacteriota bacterium]